MIVTKHDPRGWLFLATGSSYCGPVQTKTAAPDRQMPPSDCSKLRSKRYRNTAANHAEVVLRASNNISAEVVHQTNGGREAHFKPAAELAHCFGFAAAIARTDDIAVRCANQFLTPATAENRALLAMTELVCYRSKLAEAHRHFYKPRIAAKSGPTRGEASLSCGLSR